VVRELVSYQVAGGGKPLPPSSAPVLIYYAPPGTPSPTPSQVAAAQPLGASPVAIYALQGSVASVNGTISGPVGERWAAVAQSWTVAAPDQLPSPILFYDQFKVSIGYLIFGGGTPPNPPEFSSTALGVPASIKVSGNSTTGWFDAGSAASFTSVLNGTNPGERWLGSASGGAATAVSIPDAALLYSYAHQFYADLGVNDPRGGSVSPAPQWIQAGSPLHAVAHANLQWQFEAWNGSGAGAYTGTAPTIDVAVDAPLSEKATFFVQLTIAADSGTSIAYSFGPVEALGRAHVAGTVPAGTTETVYVPPSANVTLRAVPSLLYSFASWKGAGPSGATEPSLMLVVDSPGAVTGTSSYNYPVIIGGAAALIVVLAASVWIRGRRRGDRLGSFNPGTSVL
jgi:hypothetical protein